MKYLASLILAWFAVGIAAASLVGHWIGKIWLASWMDGAVPMAVSTAVMGLSLAGSILLRFSKRSKGNKWHDAPTTIK